MEGNLESKFEKENNIRLICKKIKEKIAYPIFKSAIYSGLALASILNPISTIAQENKIEYSKQINYKRFTTNKDYEIPLEETIPWKDLSIMSSNGDTTKLDYKTYESIVDEVNKNIQRKERYNKEEIIQIFNTIHNVIKKKGIVYGHTFFLNNCFKEGKTPIMDCEDYSEFYYGIGQALNIPLRFMRCKINKNGALHTIIAGEGEDGMVKWETTIGKEINKDTKTPYKDFYSLNEKEIIGERYCRAGRNLLGDGMLDEGIKNLEKGLYLLKDFNIPEEIASGFYKSLTQSKESLKWAYDIKKEKTKIN